MSSIQNVVNIANSDDDDNSDDDERIFKSFTEKSIVSIDDSVEVTHRSTAKIPRVLRKSTGEDSKKDYVSKVVSIGEDSEKNYVPEVVSIGPYHHGNSKLEFVEGKKFFCTRLLLKDNKESLGRLYRKLRGMVVELRGFYEEKDEKTTSLSDEDFTEMMLLDSCFILFYILYIFEDKLEDYKLFKGDTIIYIHRDLFLMENQIPFGVLEEVMKLVSIPSCKIYQFVYGTFFSSPKPSKLLRLLQSMFCMTPVRRERWWRSFDLDLRSSDHLLVLLHIFVTEKVKDPIYLSTKHSQIGNDDTANELADIGIQFKPSDSNRPRCVKFVKGCLELPLLTVNNSTKATWLNLITFEKVSLAFIKETWVTWYVCFLHSLVEKPEDVKVLRKARVLGNCTGRDKDIVTLFKQIAIGLVPDDRAYLGVKYMIQEHCENWRTTLLSQLKHEYLKTPWSYLALLGALLALFLSVVQTYFTVWNPKSECDDLCKSLKMNHHL